MQPDSSATTKRKLNHFNQSLGNLLSLELLPFGLRMHSAEDTVEVSVYSPNALRIRIFRSDEVRNDFSYAVVAHPQENGFSVVESDEEIHLSTSALLLKISKYPLRFSFFTLDGKLINADDPAFGTSRLGNEITTYKVLHEQERFIGLGEKTGPLDRRGKAYVNWNTDHFAYGVDADPIYMSTPFFIGIKDESLAYGIFLDNTHRSTFNFGASNNRFAYFQAEAGEMNYYFFHHDSVEGIVKEYANLTGKMSLPPRWSLGFQQCRYSYYPDREVLSVAKTFRDKNIPADVIYLDIHYMDAYKVFTWHKERFPEPKALADELKALGFHLVLILDPGVKIEKGYAPYEEALQNDLLIKYPDGSHYAGQVWPGWSHFPDFTKAATREWWGNALQDLADTGIEGYWNDMNEPAAWGQHLPDLIEFDYDGEGATHKKARNVYGFNMARSTYEGARKNLKGHRPFVLTRAGFSGIQRYSAVWTGDNVASDEHMMAGIRLVNSLGLAGVAFAGYDVGGFAGEASPELMARWISIGAFSPFFRAHSMINSRDAEPWAFGEETEAIARNYIRLRYRLMPYLYSMFYEAHQSGIPVARSLALNHAFDENIYRSEYQNQYLFGGSFLVVPVESKKDFTKVYLPEGLWFNFYTDQLHTGQQELLIELAKEVLPLYVKAGSIIPMQSQLSSLQDKPSETLYLHVFGGADGSFLFYEDDGLTYAYEQNAFFRREISFDASMGSLYFSPAEGEMASHFKKLQIFWHGMKAEATFILNGKPLAATKESLQYIDPPDDFDPFTKADKKGLCIDDLPCVLVDHFMDEFIITIK
jgi:alpha-glucosidase